MYQNFDAILAAAKALPVKRIMAVAAAEDLPVLEAALRAKADGIVDLILVGNGDAIRQLLTQLGADPAAFPIVDCPHEEAGQTAVSLVRDGKAHFLMKGLMETRELLGPVVRKENGLRTGRVMSHFALNELPGYHKLIVNTDGGMLIAPTLEEKKSIIENAVTTLRAMGYECPKVAILAGVETVNPKMPETLDAQALVRLWEDGQLPGCVVEGPVSYDVAISREIAAHKSVPYVHCGDYDVLVAPNMAARNILGKCWSVTAHSKMAGIIVGARVPVVLSSRGSTAEEKYYSIALAATAAEV